jgi:hypothetical protein
VLLCKYRYGDRIREDEIGGAFGKYGRNLKLMQSFGVKYA